MASSLAHRSVVSFMASGVPSLPSPNSPAKRARTSPSRRSWAKASVQVLRTARRRYFRVSFSTATRPRSSFTKILWTIPSAASRSRTTRYASSSIHTWFCSYTSPIVRDLSLTPTSVTGGSGPRGPERFGIRLVMVAGLEPVSGKDEARVTSRARPEARAAQACSRSRFRGPAAAVFDPQSAPVAAYVSIRSPIRCDCDRYVLD